MSETAAPAPAAPPAPQWEPLAPVERRVLGVLVEKQKTSKSSDSYPLTLNALQTGCNQKSNRDPVFDLDELEVEAGIEALQPRGLVTRITGGRADRFRHELYNAWTSDGPQLAVLAELLLRGPQTKGDLRVRASRMAPIDTLEVLEEVLKPLVERRLVVYLTEPDRRGAVLTHGFHSPDELDRLRATHGGAPASPGAAGETAAPRAVAPSALAALEAKLGAALEDIAGLQARVAALEKRLASPASPASPAPSNAPTT